MEEVNSQIGEPTSILLTGPYNVLKNCCFLRSPSKWRKPPCVQETGSAGCAEGTPLVGHGSGAPTWLDKSASH